MTCSNSTPNTTQSVREYPAPGCGRVEIKTAKPGLRLRVSATGVRRYVWYYTHPYKTNKKGSRVRSVLDLGDALEMGYGEAGDALDDARGIVAAGHDPSPIKQLATIAGTSLPITLEELAVKFYEQRICTIRDRPEVARQILYSVVIPEIGGVPLSQLTQDHLLIPCHKLAGRGREAHAKSTFKLVAQMMKWAVARKQHPDNPMLGLTLADAGVPDNSRPRDRTLADDEIKRFFAALSQSQVCEIKQLAMRLLLLTGCRTREIRLNTWSNVNLGEGVMIIPISLLKSRKKVKGLKPMRVPMAQMSVDILRRLKQITGTTGYILGDPTTTKPLGEPTLRNSLAKVRDREGIAQFTVHDLRRTARTILPKLKVPFEVCELYLGHALPQIVRTYATGDMFEERQEAANTLANYLKPLMDNGTEKSTKVVSLMNVA